MKIFAARGRRVTAAVPEASGSLPPGLRAGLPHGYEVVGEALASGTGVGAACAVAGQELARDGGSMQEALEALRTTSRVVMGTDPSYDAVVALLTAWNETTLGYLLQISCEDPLTGLASQAHLRTRLAELYRSPGTASYDLVVCTMPSGDDPSDEQGDHFTRAMRQARMGEMARTVFLRNETIARLGTARRRRPGAARRAARSPGAGAADVAEQAGDGRARGAGLRRRTARIRERRAPPARLRRPRLGPGPRPTP